MSFVMAQPEILRAVVTDLQGMGNAMELATTAAANTATSVITPAADAVSTLTAAHLAAHAQLYQAMSAQAAAVHRQFVATLATGAASYAETEAANAATVG